MGVRAQLSNYVKKETAEIRSVQLNDTDWTDLAAFAAAVKDKRVVMLGEQTHGDGTTFALKARLVRFLHEQIGFNVLAFESDFISLAGYEKQRDSADAALFLSKNVFGIWTACNTVKPFFLSCAASFIFAKTSSETFYFTAILFLKWVTSEGKTVMF
jgi:erythromycin esterase-like protein